MAGELRPAVTYNPNEQDMKNFVDMDKQLREQRVYNIAEYWRLYLDQHWNYDEKYDDRPTVYRNKIKVMLNKVITHATARAPYPIYFNDEVEKLLHPYVKLLLDSSGGMEMIAYEVFLYSAVTGDSFVKAYIDDEGKARLQVLESHMCDPYYDIIDNTQLIPDMIELRGFKYSRQADETGEVNQTIVSTKEIWNSEEVKVYNNRKLSVADSGPNLLEIVPVVHIRNQIMNKNIFGTSDIAGMKDLNLLLNSAMRGFQEIVDYSADPWLLMYGYSMANVDKNATRTLSNINPEGRTELLELKTDMKAIQKWIEYLDTSLHEQGGIPVDSTTGKTGMGNVSGTAYHYDMYPITEVVDRKILTHRAGLARAIELGLMLMHAHARKYKGSPYKGLIDAAKEVEKIYAAASDPLVVLNKWYTTNIEFCDYLQKDELSRTNLIVQKYTNNLMSRKSAMRELGVKNILEEEELILQEMKQAAMLDPKNDSIPEQKGTNEIKSDDEKPSSRFEKDNNDTLREQEKQTAKGSKNDKTKK